jgi:hypothetical protein
MPVARVAAAQVWPRDEEREAAALWAARACAEWASVPAFWELAEQLDVCGAPAALADRALAAAADEIRHALHAAGVAASLAGAAVALEPPAHLPRQPATGPAGLLRLAAESWTDGCLTEGAAAACATAEADAAGIAALRSALRQVAVDEKRHAELAWDILAWSLAAAEGETRAAVRAVASQPIMPPGIAGTQPSLHAYGCLSSLTQAEIGRRHLAEACTRRDVFLTVSRPDPTV